MRVTQNSIMSSYSGRLNKVLSGLNTANEKAITQRKFLKASENPSESIKASRFRRDMANTENWLDNVNTIQANYENLEGSMLKISNYADTVYLKTIEANGTYSSDERKILAEEIRGLQQSAVMELNSKFNGKHIFGGSAGNDAPFALKEVAGDSRLFYRGFDVTTGRSEAELTATPPDFSLNQAKLDELANETIYMDLGFGLEVDGLNKVNGSSAFNVAMPGIKLTGFGYDPKGDETGAPGNLIVLMGEMAKLLEKDPYVAEDLATLGKTLEKQRSNILINLTSLGTEDAFLTQTKSRLEDNQYILNKKIVDTEFMTMDEAITQFKAQEYAYQAALKMGMKILTPSFIDFMQ